ncbi:MAG: hypothetical protein ABL857_01970 [Rickettsiales bacterium]
MLGAADGVIKKQVHELIQLGLCCFVFGAQFFYLPFLEHFLRFAGAASILPATKAVGKLFGVKEEDVERMKKTHDQLEDAAPTWETRMENQQSQEQQAAKYSVRL